MVSRLRSQSLLRHRSTSAGSLFLKYQKRGNPIPRPFGNGGEQRSVRRKTYHASPHLDNLNRMPNGKLGYLRIRFVPPSEATLTYLTHSLARCCTRRDAPSIRTALCLRVHVKERPRANQEHHSESLRRSIDSRYGKTRTKTKHTPIPRTLYSSHRTTHCAGCIARIPTLHLQS